MRGCLCLPIPDCHVIHTEPAAVHRISESVSVMPVHSPTEGFYILVRFRDGSRVKYCHATAAELARRFPDKFAHLADLPIAGVR